MWIQKCQSLLVLKKLWFLFWFLTGQWNLLLRQSRSRAMLTGMVGRSFLVSSLIFQLLSPIRPGFFFRRFVQNSRFTTLLNRCTVPVCDVTVNGANETCVHGMCTKPFTCECDIGWFGQVGSITVLFVIFYLCNKVGHKKHRKIASLYDLYEFVPL